MQNCINSRISFRHINYQLILTFRVGLRLTDWYPPTAETFSSKHNYCHTIDRQSGLVSDLTIDSCDAGIFAQAAPFQQQGQ